MIMAIIYVHQHCPVCQSLLRFTSWRGASMRKCVPIIFRDVDQISTAEKRTVYPYTYDPQYGAVFRVVTPYLVIADVSLEDGFRIERVYYRKVITPAQHTFTEPEVREIIYTTHAWCSHVRESAEHLGEKSRRRGRKSKKED